MFRRCWSISACMAASSVFADRREAMRCSHVACALSKAASKRVFSDSASARSRFKPAIVFSIKSKRAELYFLAAPGRNRCNWSFNSLTSDADAEFCLFKSWICSRKLFRVAVLDFNWRCKPSFCHIISATWAFKLSLSFRMRFKSSPAWRASSELPFGSTWLANCIRRACVALALARVVIGVGCCKLLLNTFVVPLMTRTVSPGPVSGGLAEPFAFAFGPMLSSVDTKLSAV
mmetsp:Transcript_124756/g.358295  ORF Transcript_124756/g.358295 Transcript_124756/m.358295 type:complete len:232 (-) Transcript_124756:156-851(-)